MDMLLEVKLLDFTVWSSHYRLQTTESIELDSETLLLF